mmetsp:Transcript_40434/g.108560  ORF Transcript_40434/g.108560 Transcript_40434/m.108560 type:complete len:208 (-) Transcript_40434:765-1388(-)
MKASKENRECLRGNCRLRHAGSQRGNESFQWETLASKWVRGGQDERAPCTSFVRSFEASAGWSSPPTPRRRNFLRSQAGRMAASRNLFSGEANDPQYLVLMTLRLGTLASLWLPSSHHRVRVPCRASLHEGLGSSACRCGRAALRAAARVSRETRRGGRGATCRCGRAARRSGRCRRRSRRGRSWPDAARPSSRARCGTRFSCRTSW